MSLHKKLKAVVVDAEMRINDLDRSRFLRVRSARANGTFDELIDTPEQLDRAAGLVMTEAFDQIALIASKLPQHKQLSSLARFVYLNFRRERQLANYLAVLSSSIHDRDKTAVRNSKLLSEFKKTEQENQQLSDFYAETTAARRRGAKVAHREHYEMKDQLFLWLDENMTRFKSMDKAAEASVKVVPVATRTARKWVGEWRKQRSASKA